ncbi:MAG: hypothetical protein RJA81_1303 [Planctomycetota bacterium]
MGSADLTKPVLGMIHSNDLTVNPFQSPARTQLSEDKSVVSLCFFQ